MLGYGSYTEVELNANDLFLRRAKNMATLCDVFIVGWSSNQTSKAILRKHFIVLYSLLVNLKDLNIILF